MNQETQKFKKKVYSKLESSPLSDSIASSIPKEGLKGTKKKIISVSTSQGLREEFKRSFLPLLIDVIELRQILENYKSQHRATSVLPPNKISKSPQEIIKRLEQIQKDIEETKRWCNGVILQIHKGIEEAKEALSYLQEHKHFETEQKVSKRSLLRRLFRR